MSEDGLTEKEIYQRRYIERESNERCIYAITDGSHILIDDSSITAFGEIYFIKDEVIEKICENGEKYVISGTLVL